MSADTPEEWTEEQNSLFTRLHKMVSETQSVFMHPDAPRLGDKEWATVAWNVAWTAAHMLGSDDPMVFVDADSGEELAIENPGVLQ